MSGFDIVPLTGSLGAEIREFNLGRKMATSDIQMLRQALNDYHVIFFPDQQLTQQEHIDFAKHFGPLTTKHPSYLSVVDGHPELVELDGSRPEGRADEWHTDITISPIPPMGSILYMKESPASGGDTLWANLCDAYDALSAPMQQFLDSLTAIHDVTQQAKICAGEPEKLDAMVAAHSDAQIPMAQHPVVRTHPDSGRKCLFVNPIFTCLIRELSLKESTSLLNFLYTHITQPEFTCRRKWSRGDVGFWDNRCTAHYAVNDYGDQTRIIQRVTIEDTEAPY